MTQTERILAYIREFGTITPLEAIRDIGCYRLSARIADLRDQGYDIISEPLTVKNRYGGVSRVARYRERSKSDG